MFVTFKHAVSALSLENSAQQKNLQICCIEDRSKRSKLCYGERFFIRETMRMKAEEKSSEIYIYIYVQARSFCSFS
jgi:hypothetical protein